MATQILLLSLCVGLVYGHGRLIEPPSRGSMWRFGFKNPPNYNDNALWCGGFGTQKANGGKCGVCGDNWKGPRHHEAGGKYANGIIARRYKSGQVIDVTVDLTANHVGWFEFRICPHDNPKKAITHECLNRHLLEMADGSGTRFSVKSGMKIIRIKLRLPEDIDSCSQCVLQWKYNTGNNWGKDPETGRRCLGCGPQEQFYGCADVSIASSGNSPAYSTYPTVRTTIGRQQSTTTGRPTSTRGRQTTTEQATELPPKRTTIRVSTAAPLSTEKEIQTTTRERQTTFEQDTELPPKTTMMRATTVAPQSTEKEILATTLKPTRGTVKPATKPSHQYCRAKGRWEKMAGFNRWCRENCRAGYCPPSHCTCQKP